MSKIFSVDEYIEAGCMQFENLWMGVGLYNLTRGEICTECPFMNNCPAQHKLMKAEQTKQKPTAPTLTWEETVRDEAARRKISIKQVRRERNEARIAHETTNQP